MLFELAVTKAWLRQVTVALTLIGRSAYRGVVEFLRDLLGLSISVGSVHDVLEAAARQAGAINHDRDLSGIRAGLHDESFQGATPVLAGVDAASTYCYILAAEQRRDADTWGVHLLGAAEQGLRPDYTIADAGQGLRAGQRAAWGGTLNRPGLPEAPTCEEDGAMTQKAAKRFSPGLRERAVRMVQDREREGGTQWASVGAIAAKIGCSRETLRRWVRQGERDVAATRGVCGWFARDRPVDLSRPCRAACRPRQAAGMGPERRGLDG